MPKYTDINVYAPCPCGSGKKYKFCCLTKDREIKRQKKYQPFTSLENKLKLLPDDVLVMDLNLAENLNLASEKLLAKGKINEALVKLEEAKLKAPLLPTTHNNIANCKYLLGNLEEAISIAEFVIENLDHDNVYTLGNLVHFYLIAGKESLANSHADKLLSLELRDISWLYKKCEAFARLKRHEDVITSIENYTEPLDYIPCHFLAGVAYANANKFDKAITHLEKLKKHHHQYPMAHGCLKKIKKGTGPATLHGDWPYFGTHELISQRLSEKMRESFESLNENPKSVNNFGKKHPIMSEMALIIFNESEGRSSEAVDMLGKVNIPKSNDMLIKITEGKFGSDECRFSACRNLIRNGVWKKETPRKIWANEQWREVILKDYEITREAGIEIEDKNYDIYAQGVEALKNKRWKTAEKTNRKLIVKQPEFAAGYNNLAVALLNQGRSKEASDYLKKAIEVDPSYLFAPSTLVQIYITEDRIDDAEELLKTIVIPEQVHPDAMVCYLSTQVQLYLYKKDFDMAVKILDQALMIAPDNPELKQMSNKFFLLQRMKKIL